MTSVVRTAEGTRQTGLPHRSRWLYFIPAAALVVGIAAAVLWFSPPMVTDAGECAEVTSSYCRPFLDALYLSLGESGGEVASVRGRPWCGADACQPLFGQSVLRLRVTYYDGTTAEYLCSAGPLDDPVCRLAAPDA
jgi:hypothetical protein